MNFESITAIAFGGLHGEKLDFGSGLNIIYGPNESGKSTWHSAIYAVLCGRRRGRGRHGDDDLDSYRPWVGSTWELRAVIQRADGHRVEFFQELNNRVNCTARDLDMGREYSNELIFDGSVDGSRWLGLNRKTFRAIACVQQAQILSVLQDAQNLQVDLQRAAATGGTDATAARALAIIEDFRRANVGHDRANSKRPLRLAIERRNLAEAIRNDAISQHKEFMKLQAEGQRLKGRHAECEQLLRLAKAAAKRHQAIRARRKLERVEELLKIFPTGPPRKRVDDEQLAREVQSAIQSWEDRPQFIDLTGDSAEHLRAELSRLPEPPEGDLEPAEEVDEALKDYKVAGARLDQHRQQPAPTPKWPDTGGADSEELRRLAEFLAEPKPEVDEALSAERSSIEGNLASLQQQNKPWLGIVATMAAVSSGLSLVGYLLSGTIVLLIVAMILAFLGALAIVFWFRSRNAAAEVIRLHKRLREVDQLLGENNFRAQNYFQKLEQIQQRLQELGLSADPKRLTELATEHGRASADQVALQKWQSTENDLLNNLKAMTRALADTLQTRGIHDIQDLQTSVDGYYKACRERRRQSLQASRRTDLEKQLANREQREQDAAAVRKKLGEAERRIVGVAARLEFEDRDFDKLVTALQQWLDDRIERIKTSQVALEQYVELENLLDGSTLEQLRLDTSELINEFRTLAQGFSKNDIVGYQFGNESCEARIRKLQDQRDHARTEVDLIAGQICERTSKLADVSAADEDLEAAREELKRVRQLDETLALTHEFLSRAQERVHRDIAPRLRQFIERWISQVTDGRYTAVGVDPQNLELKVCDPTGYWRHVEDLSHGTAEQIYLLLRAAIAEHIVTVEGESCPLILDDVTVQSDARRTEAVLRVVHEISRERQVILFSQEEQVRDWARENLQHPNDRFVELTRETTPPN